MTNFAPLARLLPSCSPCPQAMPADNKQEEETRKLLRETWHSMERESTADYLDFQRALSQANPRLIELPPHSYDWTKLDEAAAKIEQAEINESDLEEG